MKRIMAIVSIVAIAGLFLYRVSVREKKEVPSNLDQELASNPATMASPTVRGPEAELAPSGTAILDETTKNSIIEPPSDGEDYADKPIPNYEASVPKADPAPTPSSLPDAEKQIKLDEDLKGSPEVASVLDVRKIDCTGGVCSIDVTIKGEKVMGEQMAMINFLRANKDVYGDKYEIKPIAGDPRSFVFVILQ